jgi:hypothetical protein
LSSEVFENVNLQSLVEASPEVVWIVWFLHSLSFLPISLISTI